MKKRHLKSVYNHTYDNNIMYVLTLKICKFKKEIKKIWTVNNCYVLHLNIFFLFSYTFSYTFIRKIHAYILQVYHL